MHVFQLPSQVYYDIVQILAALGNYQIQSLKTFSQINRKRADNNLSFSDSQLSDSQSESSSSFTASSSGVSYFSNSVYSSADAKRELVYTPEKHARRSKRLLIDIQTLLQSITRETRENGVRSKSKYKYKDQLIISLQNCIQRQGEQKTVIMAIRAAFC